MQVGESSNALIEARWMWNDTGIMLVAGQEYQFQATGQWTDWTITCDANGFESPNLVLRLSECLRRVPQEPWLALIGSIEKDKQAFFRIGRERVFSPTKTGRLYCFANDVSIAYGNNRGSIQLSVTRLT